MKKEYSKPAILSHSLSDSINVYSVSGFCGTDSNPPFGSIIDTCGGFADCQSICGGDTSSCSSPCGGTALNAVVENC